MQKIWKFLRTRNDREVMLLLGCSAVLLCVWAFVAIASEAGEPEHRPLEERILRSFRSAEDPHRLVGPAWVEEVTRDCSALGGMAITVLLLTLITGYLVLDGKLGLAALLICATGSGAVVGASLKHFFARPRPTVVPLLDRVSDWSFPSGHSFNSAVVYITLGIVLAEATARKAGKVYCIGAGFLVSGLIGVSRVMLGVHYPTDVLGGWAAGTGWAAVALMTYGFFQKDCAVGQRT